MEGLATKIDSTISIERAIEGSHESMLSTKLLFLSYYLTSCTGQVTIEGAVSQKILRLCFVLSPFSEEGRQISILIVARKMNGSSY